LRIKIKKLRPDAVIPAYAHGLGEDAGVDLHAVDEVVLMAGVPTLVKTGLAIELPTGYEAQIRPRSGLALKHGITVVNAPGTVDPSYRGEIGVILRWDGYKPNALFWGAEYVNVLTREIPTADNPLERFVVKPGDRIAQMIISQFTPVTFEEVDELSDTTRGAGGFGSSGT
jgi:dUTP pyrophosphatase